MYLDWLHGRRTLREIGKHTGLSIPTLQKHFDALEWPEGLLVSAPEEGINLLVDATFFGRQYGYLCFHDTKRVIWFREIRTENVAMLRRGLRELRKAGFRFKSVTIDGRRGYYQALRSILGAVPIQMCLFHQKAMIRRYVTDKPTTVCGQEIRAMMKSACVMKAPDFITALYSLTARHREFLLERNENNGFKHKKIRAALRSLQENLPQMFTWQELPEQNIPPTINHLEGLFAHLKERVKIHRGLKAHRKKKAIRAFLNSF